MNKYKRGLVADIREKKEFETRQKELKKKHHIQDDRIVVEKSNMIKFTVRTLSSVLRIIAGIAVCALAVIGLASLIYPEPRAALLRVAENIYLQLQWYLGL